MKNDCLYLYKADVRHVLHYTSFHVHAKRKVFLYWYIVEHSLSYFLPCTDLIAVVLRRQLCICGATSAFVKRSNARIGHSHFCYE